MKRSAGPRYLMYLAVVPVYRESCMRLLLDAHASDIEVLAGDRHLDPTVTTGLPETLVARVRNVPLLGRRLLLQAGGWRKAVLADVCIVDLNPRSVTAWAICGIRKILNRRTLAWGHLHPRAGSSAPTAPLRILLRKWTSGTILYGYDSVVPARAEIPDQPVWVAPNSLYNAADIQYANHATRRSILYVGRLEEAKNVQILVDAFEKSNLWRCGYTLDIVGSGALEGHLRRRSADLKIENAVRLHGRIDNVGELREIYARALFSVSPGYVGLSLTQSLGFGVPVLYAADAPHAPEIELTRFGGTRSFGPANVDGLARSMSDWANEISNADIDGEYLSKQVRRYYSAESMAAGIWSAVTDTSVEFGADGWPMDEEVEHGK